MRGFAAVQAVLSLVTIGYLALAWLNGWWVGFWVVLLVVVSLSLRSWWRILTESRR